MSAPSLFLRAALEFATERRRPVFPVEPHGKRPIVRGGLRAATLDPNQIERWWARTPQANIGLLCGHGLLVLDVDGPQGAESLAALERKRGPLPATVEALTPRGRHLFFGVDGSAPTTSGKLGLGIDTRGDGAYVVAAPSIHPSGRRYRWRQGRAAGEHVLANAPGWVLEALRRGGALGAVSGPETAPSIPVSRDLSRSGVDIRLALRMLREGATDDEIERALYRTSEKIREEKRTNAATYVSLTIEAARSIHEANTVRAVVRNAILRRLPARFGKPELTWVALDLVTADGEVIDAVKVIVPSQGYPRASACFAAALPDLDAARLAAPWREVEGYWPTLRLHGRAIDVAIRNGEIKWMRAAPDSTNSKKEERKASL